MTSTEIVNYKPSGELTCDQQIIKPPFTNLDNYRNLTERVWNDLDRRNQKREKDFRKRNPLRSNEEVETRIVGYAQIDFQPNPVTLTETHANVFEPLSPDEYSPWYVLRESLRRERHQIADKWSKDISEGKKAIDLLVISLKFYYLNGTHSPYCQVLYLGESLDNNGLSSEQQMVFNYCQLQGLPVCLYSEISSTPREGSRQYFLGIDMKTFEEKLAEQKKRKPWTKILQRFLPQK